MERRVETLSKARIAEAAVAILDASGEDALTFRALAAYLETGSGAIYWHVRGKDDVLAAAAEQVIGPVVAFSTRVREPRKAIRALASGVFDAIEAHPWVGAQLSRDPWQDAVLGMVEAVGQRVAAFDVPEAAQFHAAAAVLSFMLGLGAQYAAHARLRAGDRAAVLASVAARWAELDARTYPFARRVAAQVAEHDDREQFLAGVELIVRGIEG